MLRSYNLSAKAYVQENFRKPACAELYSRLGNCSTDHTRTGGSRPDIQYHDPRDPCLWAVNSPEGGSQMLAEALARYVDAHGGKVVTDAPVG